MIVRIFYYPEETLTMKEQQNRKERFKTDEGYFPFNYLNKLFKNLTTKFTNSIEDEKKKKERGKRERKLNK